MKRFALLVPILLFASCNNPFHSMASSSKEQPPAKKAIAPDFAGDQTVYVEAHNMDAASKLELEPFFLNQADLYFSENSDCSGVFVTKNRATADYELRFDYIPVADKVRIIGRLTILWDKSEMVVWTWSGRDVKEVVNKGASETCSRITLLRAAQPPETKNHKAP